MTAEQVERMWPESWVKRLVPHVILFGFVCGFSLGVLATLLVWSLWW